MSWATELDLLRRQGAALGNGLTETEFTHAERVIGCSFPPDLRELLACALPMGPKFPDWRSPDSDELLSSLAWPLKGLLFDVEHNAFWFSEWGAKPATFDDAKTIATKAVRSAPTLIPIFAHRYIPARPCQASNPVFSVYQTDIIYFGTDLRSYLRNEFGGGEAAFDDRELKVIEFWSDLAAGAVA